MHEAVTILRDVSSGGGCLFAGGVIIATALIIFGMRDKTQCNGHSWRCTLWDEMSG